MEWITLGRVGYVGRLNARLDAVLGAVYGSLFRFGHVLGSRCLGEGEAWKCYEDAYLEFFRRRPEIREWLTRTASEVYDCAPSNVQSGLDYRRQEASVTHLQDIAIRRALTRLRLEEDGVPFPEDRLPSVTVFRGDHLVEVRGAESEGFALNPGKVPFHRPDLVPSPERAGWWDAGSIEAWWQSSKVLQIPAGRSARLAELHEEACPGELALPLETLLLLWVSDGEESEIRGVGWPRDGIAGARGSCVGIPPSREEVRLLEPRRFFADPGSPWPDLILRPGDSLPAGTLPKLRRLAREVVVIPEVDPRSPPPGG